MPAHHCLLNSIRDSTGDINSFRSALKTYLFTMQRDMWRIRGVAWCTDVINVFNVFWRFLLSTFLLFKRLLEIPSKISGSTFETHRNEIIGLDFIVKVAGCRAALCSLRTELTLGGAYSDMAAVTQCSRRNWRSQYCSQYVKSLIATNWIKF